MLALRIASLTFALARFRPIGLCLALALAVPAEAAHKPPARPRADLETSLKSPAAELVIWNRRIATFRVPFENWTPAERAARAATRIGAAPASDGHYEVARRAESIGANSGFLFSVNGEFAFRLLEGDVDAESGETLEQAASTAEQRLRDALDSRVQQGRWSVIAKGVGLTAGMTLAIALALIGLARLRRWTGQWLGSRLEHLRRRAVVGGINLWPILGGLRQVLTRILYWSFAGVLVYLWLALVLEQFPYSKPWGDALGSFLAQVFSQLTWSVIASLPNLFVVLVIVALTHAFNRGVGAYFLTVERGEASVPWLTSEIARATRQIFALLVWVFALVVAYPYIPGSETAAFKGVSVFIGLMVSLGSAGLVNQVMSGLTVIYSRAYRHGEFVRIGDQEGRVLDLGLLATTIQRPGGTEVSIPNAVVTGHMILNYSRVGREGCEVVITSVTIGYDAPWRKVHELLERAAQRTPELAREPVPLVTQRALSDFYVEYQLQVPLAPGTDRRTATSRLHAEIQDAFNEDGIQIMSPHFEGQPAQAVVVPRSAWFGTPQPARVNESRGTA
jgi:small-conductance mechanosensitive channel